MAVQFRSGFFGFNRDDVLEYVHKKDAESKAMSASYKERIAALEAELAALKAEFGEAVKNNAELTAENAEMAKELAELRAKAEEVEVLARKIGRLYLVSKSSAKSIVSKAEENAAAITDQANVHLENIESAEESLHELARRIVSASDSYVSELNSISAAFDEVKVKISERDAERIRISEEFSEIYEKLS